jgi:hypothetical protein
MIGQADSACSVGSGVLPAFLLGAQRAGAASRKSLSVAGAIGNPDSGCAVHSHDTGD